MGAISDSDTWLLVAIPLLLVAPVLTRGLLRRLRARPVVRIADLTASPRARTTGRVEGTQGEPLVAPSSGLACAAYSLALDVDEGDGIYRIATEKKWRSFFLVDGQKRALVRMAPSEEVLPDLIEVGDKHLCLRTASLSVRLVEQKQTMPSDSATRREHEDAWLAQLGITRDDPRLRERSFSFSEYRIDFGAQLDVIGSVRIEDVGGATMPVFSAKTGDVLEVLA